MSSSNSVKISIIEETIRGETPAVGDFGQIGFTSESLSGTPETTESQKIRNDRLASGMVVTGLTVGGDIGFELSPDAVLNKFMESAMLSSFAVDTPVTVDLEIDATLKTITRAAGDWNTDVVAGDLITLSTFVNAENNTQVFVTAINSATEISYVGPSDMVDEVKVDAVFVVADKIGIGTTKKSFSMEKHFTELTNKALIYKGMMVSSMSLSVAYGALVSGGFSFVGLDAYSVDAAVDFITNARTVTDPAASQSMNGSVDMPFIISDFSGDLTQLGFCIQSVELNLNNNELAKNCIGKAAAQDYSFNTANVEVTLSAYIADDNWDLLKKKLSQESFSLGFIVKNFDGFYAFYIPALQVSFDDPASSGPNQDIIVSMTGMGKVGPNGEKSLYIYKG